MNLSFKLRTKILSDNNIQAQYMYSNFIGQINTLDKVKYEVVSFLNASLLLMSALFLYDENLKCFESESKLLFLFFIVVSFIVSKFMDSLRALVELLIDKIQVFKCINHEGEEFNGEDTFNQNWKRYLLLQFDKRNLPIGQKYLSDLVSTFLIEINFVLTSFFVYILFLVFKANCICAVIFNILQLLVPLFIFILYHMYVSRTTENQKLKKLYLVFSFSFICCAQWFI